jgi:hypothetical protein
MGLFSFLFGTLVGKIVSFALAIIVLAIAFVVTVSVLAAFGGPEPCTPGGGTITISASNANIFNNKWDSFDAILDGGSISLVTFNESEISSRANEFAEEKGGDVRDIRVCIHDGLGEITGTLDAFGGINADFRASGNANLTGANPEVDFIDIEIGNVPGFLVDPFKSLFENAIEELLENIDLKHRYTPTLTEGQASLDGIP